MTNAAVETDQKFAFQLDEFYLDLQEDGRNIRVLSQAEIAALPFPGLRPFKTSEFQLFKGRCGQAEELLKRLKPARFLAVIGSSGTGKSSLVRAGLIPELFGADFHETGNAWNIAVCRPGKNPVANLAVALASVKAQSKARNKIAEHYTAIEELLNQSIYGLLEVNQLLNENGPKGKHANLLVIVDQFEEVFRYDRKDLGRENIENHFVDLLLKAAANQKGSVYVIITMRSEFLGDCVKYRGLPEAVNNGQYLVPGLSRNELKEVIEGPVHLTGKEISQGLVELLINEIDEAKIKANLDQLPILQHALMRTYQEACRQGATEMTYEHYKQVGEMRKALANHADAIFQELRDGDNITACSKKQTIAKLIFQTLTDASTDLKGGRRPAHLKAIYSVAAAVGATPQQVNEVIEKFRGSDTSFIMPPASTPLHEELIMDISHESLMRNWDQLKGWVEEETRYGKLYQKLNERRAEDGQLIQGPLLAELVSWRADYPVNAAWASRYHLLPSGTADVLAHGDLYTRNLRFLERSEQAAAEAKESEKTKLKEEARKLRDEEFRKQKEAGRRRMMRVLTGAVLVAIALSTWAFFSRNTAVKKEREAQAQKHKADSLVNILKSKAIIIQQAKDSAEARRDVALELSARLEKKTKDLEAAKQFAEAETKRANQLQLFAEGQKVVLEKQLVKIDVQQKELFYMSSLLDEKMKGDILNALFKEPLTTTPEIARDKHLKTALLQDINSAVEVREDLSLNSVFALKNARRLWQEKKSANKLVDSILFEIFKKNNFPKQTIDPLLFQTSLPVDVPWLLAARNDSRFAFANTGQIVTGNSGGDGLSIDNVLWTNPANNPQQSDSAGENSLAVQSNINAFALANDNTVLALKNDSIVVRQRGKMQEQVATLAGNSGIWFSEFSPNGKYLITLTNDEVLRRWNISEMRNGQQTPPDTLSYDARTKNIRQLVFSPDGDNLIVAYSDNRFDVWNVMDKKRITKFTRNTNGQSANFSPDGNHLLVATSSRYIYVYDSLGRQYGTVTLFASTRDENYTSAPITQVALSSDWTTLLVNYGSSLLQFKVSTGDSIFKRNSRTNSRNLVSKRLFCFGEEVRNARFLNRNTVIALTYNGSLHSWDTNTAYPTLDVAFKNLRSITDSTYEEREAGDPLAFEKLLSASGANRLRDAGSFYFTKAMAGDFADEAEKGLHITKAKRIFSKLAETDAGFFKQIDSGKLQTLEKFMAERTAFEANSRYSNQVDTFAQINHLQDTIRTKEAALKKASADTVLKHELSLDCWDLSWLLLFTEQYDSVILYAKRGLELNPMNDGIHTNLALAFLFKGDYAEAEAIYRKYKNRSFSNDRNRHFNDSFLQDFDDLERAGKISLSKPELYKKMESIKRDILGVK
ncbi:MAG TPA: hypothetical protein VM871_04595 [Flavisolibacter sp.]|nr:hypothetical protein [Flavisolibacter sp.]